MIRFTISWTIAKRERERRKGENEFLRKYIHMSEVWMERVQVVGHELSGKLWGEWTVDKCNCHLISQRQRGRTEAEDDKRFSRSDESAPDSASWYFGSWILHSALAADGEPRRCALQAAPPPPISNDRYQYPGACTWIHAKSHAFRFVSTLHPRNRPACFFRYLPRILFPIF